MSKAEIIVKKLIRRHALSLLVYFSFSLYLGVLQCGEETQQQAGGVKGEKEERPLNQFYLAPLANQPGDDKHMLAHTLLLSPAQVQMYTLGIQYSLFYGKDNWNSEPCSYLQYKNHFHTSGFNSSSGLPPLPGVNECSCRPAAYFPLWHVLWFSRGVEICFPLLKLIPLSATPCWWGISSGGFQHKHCQLVMLLCQAFWLLRQSLKMNENVQNFAELFLEFYIPGFCAVMCSSPIPSHFVSISLRYQQLLSTSPGTQSQLKLLHEFLRWADAI